MDLSKLPKMSQTVEAERERARAAGEGPVAGPAPLGYVGRGQTVVAAEVWISAVTGLIFVFLGLTFARYLATRLTGGEFHTQVMWLEGTPRAGQEVGYFELQGYTAWTDASLFLFGLAMLADAGMLLLSAAGRRGLFLWVGLGVTAIAVVMNVVTAALVFSAGILPLFSLLAVAVGGYLLAYQWRMVGGARGGVE